MFQVPLVTSSTVYSKEKFWEAVSLYHDRPHLVNRKLVSVIQTIFCKVSTDYQTVKEAITREALLYEQRKLPGLSKDQITKQFVRNLIEHVDKNCEITDDLSDCTGVYVSVRILLPKSAKSSKSLEVVILDKDHNTARFFAFFEAGTQACAPPFPYNLQLTPSGNLTITLSAEDADKTHAEWLADKLFGKLLKWAEENLEGKPINVQSLSLINPEDYYLMYVELKEKYGEDLVRQWPSKTGTDPQKYVFEDIAIASYLICLWKKLNSKNVKFVDLGCGNGLLVYLLNQQGFSGFGLDIRRRPTWDLYPKSTELLEEVIIPQSTFPDCNWLIGNHSDELTPWIPVIATHSSPETNFFVLPCCPYDLNGRKFIRTNTGISQYSDYMNYIRDLCEKCGFEIQTDKLRIPSTKRTCLVGIRPKGNQDFDKISKELALVLPKEVTARPKQEPVRNCTKLPRNLLEKLVVSSVNHLLAQENYLVKPHDGQRWNYGQSLGLSVLSRLLPAEDLKQLKNECGGFQTLLRNHRYLFEIHQGGVRIRKPYKLEESEGKYKDKPCWFLRNHPDGCLYDSETCAYSHCDM